MTGSVEFRIRNGKNMCMEMVPEVNSRSYRKQYPCFMVRGDSYVSAPDGRAPESDPQRLF